MTRRCSESDEIDGQEMVELIYVAQKHRLPGLEPASGKKMGKDTRALI